ncbi:DNA damage-regulated autophagy modulator protein 2b [Hypomesus transpacificus]|uniref:DNA damage-regulated autophagy modulator protein 2b n=1 Tax=Hypomesus transpacificus TaxID=137520 RepID=UPI001F0733B9|nr:DNA damage-regulated autophagy modulator protein 2b [Hypomesus transpacificus]
MWWFQQGLCILPVALVVWTAATFILAYITAVLLRHVDPLVPYISDTGTVPPERCVFGIMLDVSAFLGIATTYVRYKQVQALTEDEEYKLHKLNLFGLVLGWISSFGMCVVANFQKTTLFSMHLVGAVLTFGVGALYILVQTLVSLYMQPHVHGKTVFWVRLAVGVWTFSSIISMFVSSVIMYSSLPGVDVAHKLHWIPGETGYTAHLISTISEWSLAMSFISFFLTYIRDFQKITLRADVNLHSSHLYDSPHYSITAPVNQSETSPLLAGSI